MADSFDLCFSPDLEVAADALLTCAGFLSPPAPTSGGRSPVRAPEEACSQDKSARVVDTTPASCLKPQAGGVS